MCLIKSCELLYCMLGFGQTHCRQSDSVHLDHSQPQPSLCLCLWENGPRPIPGSEPLKETQWLVRKSMGRLVSELSRKTVFAVVIHHLNKTMR